MQFRICQMRNEGPNQHGRFTLTNERRSSGHHGFGTGNTHGPEEEVGELSNSPLEPAPVVQKLYKGYEEDDGWDDGDDEPLKFEGIRIEEECGSIGCKSKETGGQESNK